MLIWAENSQAARRDGVRKTKVPFVAAVSLNDRGHPLHIKLTVVPGFTRKAIAGWAKTQLGPGCSVLSDGLA